MALNVHKGVFAAPVANGNFDYTLPANFDPKFVMVWTSYFTAPGVGFSDRTYIMGWATYRASAVQQYFAGCWKDNAALTDIGTRFSGSGSILSGTEATGLTIAFNMTLSSMTSGSGSKITFNMVDFPNAAIKIHVWALGGSSVLDAFVGPLTTNTTGVAQAPAAAPGFQPNLVGFMGAPWTNQTPQADDLRMVLGWAKSPTERRCAAWGNNHSSANMTLGSAKLDRLLALQGNTSAAALDSEMELDLAANFPVNSFQVTWPNASSFAFFLGYAALKFDTDVDISIASASAPTTVSSTTIDSLAAGATPKGALIWGCHDPLSATPQWTAGTGGNAPSTRLGGWMMGATDGTNEGSAGIVDSSNQSASWAGWNHSETKGITNLLAVSAANPTVVSDADLSFSSNNLSASWTTVEATQAGFNILLLGEISGSTPIVGSESMALSEGSLLDITAARLDTTTFTDSPASLSQQNLLSASESYTLAELSSLAQQLALAASDSLTLTDVSLASPQFTRTDQGAFTEQSASLANAVSASESLAFASEVSALAEQRLISVIDSGVLTDASSLSTLLALAVSDSSAVSEAAALALAASVIDSWALTEPASSISSALSAAESWALSEAISAAVTLVTTDSGVFSDASAMSQLVTLSASDSLTLSEAISAAITSSLVESSVFTELSSLLQTNQVVAVDATSLAEATATTALLSVSESEAFSEIANASQLLSLSVSDAGTFVESAATAIALSVLETAFGLTETSSISAATSVSDLLTQAETLSQIATTLAANDALVLSEAAVSSQLLTLVASETFSLAAETSALALAFSKTDTGTFTEATPSIALSAVDSLALTEALAITASLSASELLATLAETAVGGETLYVGAFDLSALAEAASLANTTLKNAADSIASNEAVALTSLFAGNDSSSLAEALALVATLTAEDTALETSFELTAAEIQAFESFTTLDVALLNTAAFVHILSSLASVAATIASMVSVSRPINDTSDVDPKVPSIEAEADAGYDSDAEVELA